MSGAKGKVYIVDDDAAVVDSLSMLLQSDGFDCVPMSSAEAFLARHDPETQGCLVLDLRMPGMNGIELQRELRRRGNPLPAVMISGHGTVDAAVTALKDGAVDFIEKPINPAALVDAVKRALKRDAEDRERRRERSKLDELVGTLTPREREIMDEMVAGRATRDIATSFGISPRTVEVHRANVLEKMKLRSTAELVSFVLSQRGGGRS
ncbi:MAG: response regulator transcription factor [Alphaproteobacteria bacterium]|nr:response regulator transcription factor [Alphaproteobacteria bacterium]